MPLSLNAALRRKDSEILALIDKIHIVANETALQDLLETLTKPDTGKPVTIAFLNAHAFNMCHKDPVFLNDIMACDYLFRDGVGIKILFKLMGREPGLNLNGTDLIPRILTLFKNKKAALLGTQAPYLERAARKIEEGHIKVQMLMDGYQKETDYLRAIDEGRPPLVLLAMGMPKQERIANMFSRQLPYSCLVICGGAILDFLGGKVSRAPAFMRKYGLEWLYRLALEPKRLFKRYLIGNFLMVARALRLSLLYSPARIKPETLKKSL